MDQDTIDKIRNLSRLRDNDAPKSEFLLWRNKQTGLACYYAPFEYINSNAKIILVGITPGRTQMNRALNAAQKSLSAGTSLDVVIRDVKRDGSFSGKMRPKIVAILNRLGYQHHLNINCASSLWDANNHLIQFCSLLKFPVFCNDENYNGKPDPLKDADLCKMVDEHFVPDLHTLPHDALLIPLGNTVLKTIAALKKQGRIPQELMVFEGEFIAPPHPSDANAESIALLLEENYPTQEEYGERMYRDYLQNQMKKHEKPQPEAEYKKVRGSRWESVLRVRRAHNIP